MKRTRTLQTTMNHLAKKPANTARSYTPINKLLFNLGDSLNFNLFFHNSLSRMSLFLHSDTIIDISDCVSLLWNVPYKLDII
ncbi:hypothetical protein HUE87_04425 [Candidatus Sulfurimonas marisnigri]|uniref:Uncharacterized protein n=1 Tax=Candidatus Sulfurimonas marisnigri TaxID=2740405 RepID=A0A7S7RRF1_9BACT|nr:hypothetical protein [Candidatus Sulfurimonas marisnigri]QOY55485.1 hypothetical protein HUE87_04425 [Candidatus Sulfurimonas marisnigri]